MSKDIKQIEVIYDTKRRVKCAECSTETPLSICRFTDENILFSLCDICAIQLAKQLSVMAQFAHEAKQMSSYK